MYKTDIDKLSDAELRNKLVQNGFPNLPVTETTRKILIKKLNYHLNIKKKKKHRDSLNIIQHNLLDNNVELKSHNVRKSLSENYPKLDTISPCGSRFASPKATLRPISSPKMYAPAPILASESEEDSDYLSNTANGVNMRRNISLQSSFGSNNTYLSSENSSGGLYNNHYGVVNRLLSLRDNTIRKSETTHHLTPPLPIYRKQQFRPTTNTFIPQTFLANIISRTRVSPGFKQAFIPYALISSFVLFFVGLVIIYIIKSPDLPNTINESRTHFKVCNDELDKMSTFNKVKSLDSCIEKDLLDSATEFNRELIRLLHERARQTYCVDKKSDSIKINAIEFIQHYKKASRIADVRKITQDLHAAKYLIQQNPQWQIAIVNGNDARTYDGNDINYSNDESNFILIKPNLPLKCILYNKIQRFFVIIGTVALIGILSFICYIAVRYIRDRRNDRITAVDNFTTDIVNELLYRASLSDVPDEREVIVNHLRDKLLPFSKRNALLWSWNEALRIMEANDSRIQFGVTIRNGEEFRSMKWIGENISVDARSRSSCGKKQWHSPAFDNGNKIVNPPTPCLKIRHMFDSSEINHPNLKKIIEEAILEKVGAHCNIVDIQIDKQSCCVYVRCASESDAGVVHNEINGWWFDKRLVSIKFLRLQRYLCRFPKLTSFLPVSN